MLVRFLYTLLFLMVLTAAAIGYRYSRPAEALSLPSYAVKNGCHYAGIGDIEVEDFDKVGGHYHWSLSRRPIYTCPNGMLLTMEAGAERIGRVPQHGR